MPWSVKVNRAFAIADRQGEKIESPYYKAYDIFLQQLFPEDDYLVCPQHQRVSPRPDGTWELESTESVDLNVTFAIEFNDYPVLIVEIKPRSHIATISKRHAADRQIRDKFDYYTEHSPFHSLYGISALGRRICIYRYDRGTRDVIPAEITKIPGENTDTAPIDRWDIDVLESLDEPRIRELVGEIKAMCAAFQAEL